MLLKAFPEGSGAVRATNHGEAKQEEDRALNKHYTYALEMGYHTHYGQE